MVYPLYGCFVAAGRVCRLYQRRIRRRDHHGRDHHISLRDKSAAITGNTAIRLLESYSKKELGLDNVGKKKYEFMLSTIGSEIKGKKYIRAEAGYMDQTGKDENGKPVYQMKSYKTFYIAYDGKTLLIDQGDGKYKTLQIDKARLDQVTTTQASTQKHENTSKKK